MTKRILNWFLGLVLFSNASYAGVLDLGLLDPNNFTNQKLPQNITNETLKLFGIFTAHHPYTGATSMIDSNTLDLMIEGTLVKIGDGLFDAIRADGLKVPTFTTPAVPIGKIMIRKAFTHRVDFGFSGLFYANNKILGGDMKIVLHEAEEGPSYAIRLGYTYVSLPIAYVTKCSTFSPEFVMSQKLYFAEPYLGFGGRYIHGSVKISQTVDPGTGPITVNVTGTGGGTTGYAFTGVFFRIFGAQGLRLGLEGSYDLSGYSTMGMVAGLGI